MSVGLRPEAGRWLALAVGQGDEESPFELLAAVGETTALHPAAHERSRMTTAVVVTVLRGT
ncbi:hypothetical protein ABZ923_11985 [Streptomyces sp. NPDC046881]|uniref:hypothetical protein n=1 Tax=Streptomyces sp. NPDC046881 TaxID=3155374 RepID=UPI0033F56B5C